VVADAHLDLLLELAHRRRRLGERDVFRRTWLPLLETGGVALQACPVFVELERQPEGALRDALAQVACLHEAARECAERVALVRSAGDLDAVERGERIGLLLALEGAEPLGYDVWSAEVFHALGLRLASLTWNRRNPFADGVADEGGLSRLGRELVDRLVELGVVLDLAHASPRTFADVLERAPGAPVLVSHAGCRAVHDHPRNLDDAQLRALADAGGMLCVMLIPVAVDPARPTVERACEHLEHAVTVLGVGRVGLGGDFTRRLAAVLPPVPVPADGLLPPGMGLDAALEGLAGPEDYPALEAALRARGWADGDVAAVMGGNLLRFLRRALPA
jgi:membrane dipeptidase